MGYAIGAYLEMALHREAYQLFPWDVVKSGLVVAVAALVVLLGVIALWMSGSSRGHRIIVESAVVLVLGLPATCIQLVGDTNRALDDAAAREVTVTVDHCEKRRHRSRKGRISYTYHLWIEPSPGLPREIAIDKRLCIGLGAGDPVELSIGPGYWGLPWYRSITAGGETWTAP